MEFCKNAGKSSMRLPYSIGEYTYATNGHIFIKVPRITEFPENPKAPDPEKIEYLESPKEWYPVKDIKTPKPIDCDNCGGKGRNFTCPECDGDGFVCLSNNYSSYEVDCDSCDTTGEVEFCEECEGTGKAISYNPTDFNGVTFEQRYLALLSKLPNCEIRLTSKTTISPFKFDGGSGAIMPMSN